MHSSHLCNDCGVCVHRIKVKLGDKTGIIPDNFIEVIKKEAPKNPTPPLPTREEPPPASRLPPPEKKEEVCSLVN